MRVGVTRDEEGFRYELQPEREDPEAARRDFDGVRGHQLTLAERAYRVALPSVVPPPHPDVHAAAIWLVLRPFIGERLELPFGVSGQYAEKMRVFAGVELPRVDADLAPRAWPETPRSGLLFSGGVDSIAAALVLPRDIPALFMDRIPQTSVDAMGQSSVVDMVHARMACRHLESTGREVLTVREDHERLFRPYPRWHSPSYMLPALYNADSLGLGWVETGDVMDVEHFGGYRDGDASTWAFRPARRPAPTASGMTVPLLPLEVGADPISMLGLVGLTKVNSTIGLSEVATAKIVHQSSMRGLASSCYFPSPTNYCMKCDKCFKKILLDYVFEDREVPAALLDHFLSFPYLAEIFKPRIFDWHHVWYYIFQKIRCDHSFARALREQAEVGPDLAMLERWYPVNAAGIPREYRDEVVENIGRYVQTMSGDDVRALEGLEVPPLHAPDVETKQFALLPLDPEASQTGESDLGSLDPLRLAGTLRAALDAAMGPEDLELLQDGPEEPIRLLLRVGGHRIALRVVLWVAPEGPRSPGRLLHLFCEQGAVPNDERLRAALRTLASTLDSRVGDKDISETDRSLQVAGDRVQRKVEDCLLGSRGRGIGGFWPAWPVPAGGSSFLTLVRGDQWIQLRLSPRGPGFRVAGGIHISYASWCEVDTPEKRHAVEVLVKGLIIAGA